ncbi:MAG: iron-containing alcohol dehydrogenase [Planctomycetota bacterium]|jgi:alcohol dehydrogenase class IV|nr:iron-containing alcohol dehydrogenase [Planctomycetota bacterium]
MPNTFIIPPVIVSGEDALRAAGTHFARMGKRALVVADSMMEKLGNVAGVLETLTQNGCTGAVFAAVNTEPVDTVVLEGLSTMRREGCDFLVAVGGGSPIDAMKAIAMLHALGGEPADFFGKTIDQPLPPMAAIPTTAGTGSEATQFTIITDTKRDVKMLLKGPSLLPRLAVIDPAFTMTAPPAVTAATGLDALCHCVEAYTSQKAQPLSDTFALSAAGRIFANLRAAYNNPGDIRAREQMALAATEAGIAFNNSSVTLIHGMSRPIGALFHVPHGLSNAMLMEACLEYAADGARDRFSRLARTCGIAASGADDAEATGLFMKEISSLLRDLAIPTLREFGVDREAFLRAIPKMAADAMASGSPGNTRRPIRQEQIKALYRQVMEGGTNAI